MGKNIYCGRTRMEENCQILLHKITVTLLITVLVNVLQYLLSSAPASNLPCYFHLRQFLCDTLTTDFIPRG